MRHKVSLAIVTAAFSLTTMPHTHNLPYPDVSTIEFSLSYDDTNDDNAGETYDNKEFSSNIDNLREFSSEIDNLESFDQEISIDEVMNYFVAFIDTILNDPNLTSKEAIHTYITEQITKFIQEQKFLFTVSVTTRRKPQPCQHSPLDEESRVVITNAADIAYNFINIVKDPNNPENVANNIMGICERIKNIALYAATKSIPVDYQDAQQDYADIVEA